MTTAFHGAAQLLADLFLDLDTLDELTWLL